MLTRDDRTIADAREVYESIADTGIRHVGCKDVGLPPDELGALLDDMRARGHTSYLEVVSETEEATLKSARVAAELGPDCLIGGTLIEPVQEILAGSGVRFWPYVGQIVGHPCLLRGSIDEIRPCSHSVCAPSPSIPRPSSVGTPSAAVKLPSLPPPVISVC